MVETEAAKRNEVVREHLEKLSLAELAGLNLGTVVVDVEGKSVLVTREAVSVEMTRRNKVKEVEDAMKEGCSAIQGYLIGKPSRLLAASNHVRHAMALSPHSSLPAVVGTSRVVSKSDLAVAARALV